ncbi:MAG: hypothetical protein F6K36_23925 [Symploca sp. SIO3C6]|nr:hypothetical protein [Symploca sp. SIO3C6]
MGQIPYRLLRCLKLVGVKSSSFESLVCPVCPRVFNSWSSLNKHILKV